MAGVTPNARNHAGLGPKDSRFVAVDELPWEQSRFPGIETKTLFIDQATGSVTALIRMAPGARLPDHEHPLSEQSYVIDGVLVDDDGSCAAGDFVWRPAGSRHEAWAGPQGGTFLAMFQIPNKFFGRDGRETDFLGNDWAKSWSHALGK